MPKTVLAVAVLAILAVLAMACLIMTRRHGEAFDSRETIFVSIASYRDSECSETIASLFEQADDPTRVYVGVCEQNSDDPTEACVAQAYHGNIRRVAIPHNEAKGPTYARYLCSTLFRGETWFVQIDSHTKFVKGWDTKAIRCARSCPSDKAILTHYPRTIGDYGNDQVGVPVLCRSKFDSNGIPTFESVIMDPPTDDIPRSVPFVSGGFVFMPGSAVTDVPYDPDLPHLFQGEEILHSARLWTSGYDFYTPLENIVYHHYERKSKPKFWNDIQDYREIQSATIAKVKKLLGLVPESTILDYAHGMGSARSLEDYWEFTGVDIAAKTSGSESKFCR